MANEKTDDTKTEPTTSDEQPTMKTIVAQVEGVLKDFTRKANDSLAAFNTISVELEKRLTERVEKRAVEQSKAMKGYDKQFVAIEKRVKEVEVEGLGRFHKLTELRDGQRSLAKSLAEYAVGAKDALAECRKLRASAGPLFGGKLEALGTQVAGIAGMGARLESLELSNKTAISAFAKLSFRATELDDGVASLRRELGNTQRDLANLRDTFNEATKTKAAAKAEVKAS